MPGQFSYRVNREAQYRARERDRKRAIARAVSWERMKAQVEARYAS